jgi:hypothetical protein
MKRIVHFIILGCLLTSLMQTKAQRPQRDLGPSTLGVDKGTAPFKTKQFEFELLKSSQTVATLKSASNSKLDYTPGDRLSDRDKNKFYHLGDINLGFRTVGQTDWEYISTASNRSDVTALSPDAANVLAQADLKPTLPETLPLQIVRSWKKEGENVVLAFEIKNTSNQAVELGALGFPMVFNNNFNGKDLDKAHTENTFFDPYIGKDAGYLQVVQLNGQSEVLLVVPYGETSFENYRPLLDDPTQRGFTNEGLHEWMVHSKAYAETQWVGAEQWNTPTSEVLQPGQTKTYGLKFLFSSSLREIENTLLANKRPVAIGVPGYIVPMDVEAKLFIKHASKVKKWTVEPAGALELKAGKSTKNGWETYQVTPKKWGRARLTIEYADGLNQTIHYKVIQSEEKTVAAMGKFLTNEQWFDDKNDPFNRAPSVITYDYELKQQVVQDTRVWVAGLSDEAGAGSWLAAIMKQVVVPEKEEVAKLEDFVNQTIWGGIQFSEGEQKYGVKKSIFYYEPDSMPAGTYSSDVKWGQYDGFPSWSKKAAESVGRSYNYPHVAAAHWAMYRLARYHTGYVSQQNWQWYLENAAQTSIAMVEQAAHYAQFGQMEGTIFILILNDLKAEGLNELAQELEAVMKARTTHWASLQYPFGSEMPWDSTGQEEVYMWSKYFGFDEKALVTLNAILAYMPTVPHWGYDGNARRFWDFLYAGKITRFERMIHHYGSPLNAIPVLHNYRENPSDFYLLRVGHAGLMGGIANITEDGFAPCAFHSFPETMKNDAINGDYGTGFFGYAVNTSSYLYKHPEFGWLAFGGNITEKGDWVNIHVSTAAKNRVFIAEVGLWLTLDAGQFKQVAFNSKTGEVNIEFYAATAYTSQALLRIEQTVETMKTNYVSSLKGFNKNAQGASEIQLQKKETNIKLNQ